MNGNLISPKASKGLLPEISFEFVAPVNSKTETLLKPTYNGNAWQIGVSATDQTLAARGSNQLIIRGMMYLPEIYLT